MCTWSGYQKNPTNFPRKYPHRILSKQILHYQLPNSGMLFFDIFQRKLHSVWFKGYHTVFKNRPKKFSFLKKYTHKNTVRANSSLSAPKFRYVVLWYITKKAPKHLVKGLSRRIQKSPKEIFISQEIYKYNTVRANSSLPAPKFRYVVLWYITKKAPKHLVQGLSRRIQKSPKEIFISQEIYK